MVILLITQAVCSELQIQFPIPINVYSICCFSLSLSVFWWVDCVTVMWGRAYTRQRRARDVRRTAARAAAAGEAAINAATEAAITTRMEGRSVTSG